MILKVDIMPVSGVDIIKLSRGEALKISIPNNLTISPGGQIHNIAHFIFIIYLI